MAASDQCCSTRCVYIATLTLGTISTVTTVGAVIGAAFSCFAYFPYTSKFVIAGAGVALVIVYLFLLYCTIRILLLITRDNFPNEASLEDLRTTLGQTITLILVNFIILFVSPAFNPATFGASWFFVFPLCFAALAWDLQRKLWTTVPGLPRVSPHRAAAAYLAVGVNTYPHSQPTAAVSSPHAPLTGMSGYPIIPTTGVYANVATTAVRTPPNIQQDPTHSPATHNPAFNPSAP